MDALAGFVIFMTGRFVKVFNNRAERLPRFVRVYLLAVLNRDAQKPYRMGHRERRLRSAFRISATVNRPGEIGEFIVVKDAVAITLVVAIARGNANGKPMGGHPFFAGYSYG